MREFGERNVDSIPDGLETSMQDETDEGVQMIYKQCLDLSQYKPASTAGGRAKTIWSKFGA